MNADVAQGIRALLRSQRIASLGTLHEGDPYVSMAPFALVPDGSAFVIHVSALAAHTRDMVETPRVSLMIAAQPSAEVAPQAVARLTVQADAMRCVPGADGHAEAKQAYVARFPESAPVFELGDFSLFLLRPRSARFVGGFAQAKTVTAEGLAQALSA